ncbi:MAG: DUF192 domain-containing protein [bacterium]|nr:DUF192 domain-containing protein [bacterium]
MKIKHVVLAFLILIIGAYGYFIADSAQTSVVFPNGEVFFMEVADTPLLRERGLSGKEKLDDKFGMIFLYDKPQSVGIWMKDMNFPIDIIWLRNGEVVFIVKDAPPDDSPNRPVYAPSDNFDTIIEVPAGTVAMNAVVVGSKVGVSY